MKELVGRLTALDPEASKSLTVIGYFDTLMDGGVSVESLLRGAATLSGVAAGYRRGETVVHIRADGLRGDGRARDTAIYPSRAVGQDAHVWIERDGIAHANDAMILERLAIAITIISAGRTEESSRRRAVEVLLSESADEQQRLHAAARLKIAATASLYAVARPIDAEARAGAHSTTVATPWGIARGEISEDAGCRRAMTNHATSASATESTPRVVSAADRVGVGVRGTVLTLNESWRTAVIALQLADAEHPIFYADDLGVLLHLTDLVAHPADLPHDVAAIGRITATSWSPVALRAVADGLSVRAVASLAGLHHSTVHAKLPELTRMLGYDPLTPLGRTRLHAALLLWRLAGHPVDGRDAGN